MSDLPKTYNPNHDINKLYEDNVGASFDRMFPNGICVDGMSKVPKCEEFSPDSKIDSLSKRHNQGKLRFDLIPPETEKALAEVLTYGLQKYDEDQWKKGNNYTVPYSSLRRHLNAWYSGEDLDPESQLSHLKLALANVMMLLYYQENYPELDNRPGKKK